MAVEKDQREEQDLERYGVWVKTGPDQVDGSLTESLDLMDIDDSEQNEVLISEEEEKLLSELEDSSLPDFEDFDGALDQDDDLPSHGDFSPSLAGDDASTDLLRKIEGELGSLRAEIRQLKDELTGLRLPAAAPAGETQSESGGFFDEEEDETIALTGDELDNILDTADMTEEAAEDEDPDMGDEVPNLAIDEPVGVPQAELPEDNDDEEFSIEDLSDDELGIMDDDEEIDLSVTEIDDEIEIEESDAFEEIDLSDDFGEEDPALTLISSELPEEAEQGDPETLEIDIVGEEAVEEMVLEEESVVSIDDIPPSESPAEEFEEIVDLDDLAGDMDDSILMDIDEQPIPSEELVDISLDSPQESLEEELFDEGEEVELDLSELPEEELEKESQEDAFSEGMEEVSLDDFGLSLDDESSEEDDSGFEVVDLEAEAETDNEGFEEVDLGIDLGDSDEDLDTSEIEDTIDLPLDDDEVSTAPLHSGDIPTDLSNLEEVDLEDVMAEGESDAGGDETFASADITDIGDISLEDVLADDADEAQDLPVEEPEIEEDEGFSLEDIPGLEEDEFDEIELDDELSIDDDVPAEASPVEEVDEDFEEISLDDELSLEEPADQNEIEDLILDEEPSDEMTRGETLNIEEPDFNTVEEPIDEADAEEFSEEMSFEEETAVEIGDDFMEDLDEVEEIVITDELSIDEEPILEDLPEDIEDISLEANLDQSDLDDTPAVEELSLDDDDDLEIEELDLSAEAEELALEAEGDQDALGDIEDLEDLSLDMDEDDLSVKLPANDDFNELPGTEEVDLASLEALATAPDLTEPVEEMEDIEPMVDELELVDDSELTVDGMDGPGASEMNLRETPTLSSSQLDSLPPELKEEIKDVLKYMDQLLESLPEDKIQEFARSEHFEVYKKIFEELGISE